MPPKTSLPTPPGTETSRSLSEKAKTLRESSSCSNGEPFHIEQFRVGAPAPLAYLPSRDLGLSRHHPFYVAWNSNLKQSVNNILRGKGIDMQDVLVHASHFEGPYSDDPDRDDYLVVRVQTKKLAIDDSWLVSVDAIREFLRDKDWGQVVVEMIDPSLLEDNTIDVIKAGDPIIAAWKRSIRAAVMKSIKSLKWSCVGVFRKTQSESEAEETLEAPITISVALGFEQRVGTWADAEGEIRRACDEEGYSSSNLKIEFIYAEVHPSLDRQRSPGAEYEKNYFVAGTRTPNQRTKKYGTVVLRREDYALAPGMGVSIGVDRTNNESKGLTGTLGGYVELFNEAGNSQGIYALTCWHVARAAINPLASALGQGPGSVLRNFDRNGVNPKNHHRTSLRLFQPAQRDHNETLMFYQTQIENKANDYYASIENIGARDRLKQDWQSAVAEKKQFQDYHSALNDGGYFGHVFAASGFRRHKQIHAGEDFEARTDWALIEVDGKGRSVGRNILPDRNDFRLIVNMPRPEASNTPMKAMGSTSSEIDEWFRGFKKGRTTGLKSAIKNGIRSEVNIASLDQSTPDLGTSSEISYWIDTESDHQNSFFSKLGDSGAMVYNQDGVWFGIIVGGCPAHKTTYVTDAKAIRDDIKRVTGFEVRLPQ